MLSERLLTKIVRECTKQYLKLEPATEARVPAPVPGQSYMLYMHVPFCERLCPYCSFNRFPFSEDRARPYFRNLRTEMRMLKDLGYDFESLYIGGGTPTIMLDELCQTIDEARELFSIREVSSETNPNHLVPEYLEALQGRIQRLSVGVQSFDNGLLKQMDRYDKYGSAEEIFERIKVAAPYFTSLNVDMIFNFPAQTEEMLRHDLEMVLASGAGQTTFYPLMASPSVERSLAATVGKVDFAREQRFYEIISETLAGGENPAYTFGSAWTFNRIVPTAGASEGDAAGQAVLANAPETDPSRAGEPEHRDAQERPDLGVHKLVRAAGHDEGPMIDEYVVDYEEYPAIGSGGITYLGSSLYVNTFSLKEYNDAIESGRMSLSGKATFSLRDRMRYRFMMQLFGLRLDKRQFQRDFGCTVEQGLPLEMDFMKFAGAVATNDENELTLTAKGRYLMVVMMRQFFIGVNNLRDQARQALPGDERELLFGDGSACAGCGK